MGDSLIRRAVILSKIQSGEGVAATPKPELNALLVSNFQFNPDGEQIDRDFLRDSLSPLPYRSGRKLMRASFEFELKAGAATGVRPEWSPLARAAGMQESIVATVTSIRTAALRWIQSPSLGAGRYYVELVAGGDPSLANPDVVREGGDDMNRQTVAANLLPGEFFYGNVDTLGFNTVYVRLSDDADPDSKALAFVEHVDGTSIAYDFRDSGHEFATFYLYPDGHLVQCVDSLLDWTGITFQPGGIARVSANLVAKYTTPTDVVLPTTARYDQHLPPLAQSMAFTLGGYATGVIPSLSVAFNNQISERRDLNSAFGFKGNRYTGRNPTGQVSLEQELLSAFNPYTAFENATELAWSMTMGSAGQRLTFSGPSAQITSVQSGVDLNNGIRGYNLGLGFKAPGAIKEFRIFLD